MIKKIGMGALGGYLVALVFSHVLPLFVDLVVPMAGLGIGMLVARFSKPNVNLPKEYLPVAATNEALSESAVQQATTNQPTNPLTTPPAEPDPEFGPVQDYIVVLSEMIISEGQRNNLDAEIVEKSLSLLQRVQQLIPTLRELNNSEVNHTIKRLVLRDLNSFIEPFLRLSGENKMKNRRVLLDGMKDIHSKISSIVQTIEHRDLFELQTKAELIRSRYKETETF